MTTKQTYSRRQNAKRAATADLGRDAVEGVDYAITKLEDGRYAYDGPEAAATRADKAETQVQIGSAARTTTKPKKATVMRNNGLGRDQFSVRKGTKTAQAVAIFEKGARMQDVKAKLGTNFYNILNRLEGQEHTVKKGKEGFITVRPRH